MVELIGINIIAAAVYKITMPSLLVEIVFKSLEARLVFEQNYFESFSLIRTAQ